MDRAKKAEQVAELNHTFSEVGVVVVTRNLGLSVAQSAVLRNKMREAGATYKVAKNKLAKIALDGTDYMSLGDLLVGPIGLASSADPVAAAKVAIEFAKTNDKLEIVGGALGSRLLDVDGVIALASLPSLDALRSKIAGLLVAPATRLATALQAPGAQLARVLVIAVDRLPVEALRREDVRLAASEGNALVREISLKANLLKAAIGALDSRTRERISYEMLAAFTDSEIFDPSLQAAITVLASADGAILESYYLYRDPVSADEEEVPIDAIFDALGVERDEADAIAGYPLNHVRPYFRATGFPALA